MYQEIPVYIFVLYASTICTIFNAAIKLIMEDKQIKSEYSIYENKTSNNKSMKPEYISPEYIIDGLTDYKKQINYIQALLEAINIWLFYLAVTTIIHTLHVINVSETEKIIAAVGFILAYAIVTHKKVRVVSMVSLCIGFICSKAVINIAGIFIAFICLRLIIMETKSKIKDKYKNVHIDEVKDTITITSIASSKESTFRGNPICETGLYDENQNYYIDYSGMITSELVGIPIEISYVKLDDKKIRIITRVEEIKNEIHNKYNSDDNNYNC